jgi:hypothetical protein
MEMRLNLEVGRKSDAIYVHARLLLISRKDHPLTTERRWIPLELIRR